jgi:hypothetical protein
MKTESADPREALADSLEVHFDGLGNVYDEEQLSDFVSHNLTEILAALRDSGRKDGERLDFLIRRMYEVPYRGGFHDDGGYWRMSMTHEQSSRVAGPRPTADQMRATIDVAIAAEGEAK